MSCEASEGGLFYYAGSDMLTNNGEKAEIPARVGSV